MQRLSQTEFHLYSTIKSWSANCLTTRVRKLFPCTSAWLVVGLLSCARPPSATEPPPSNGHTIAPSDPQVQSTLDPNCWKFSTRNESAKYVLQNDFIKDHFNLYWFGTGETVVSFWTDDGDTTQFEVIAEPLMVVYLDNSSSSFRYVCNSSINAANACIKRFDRILFEIQRYRGQVRDGKALMDNSRAKTLSCTQAFIHERTQFLARKFGAR